MDQDQDPNQEQRSDLDPCPSFGLQVSREEGHDVKDEEKCAPIEGSLEGGPAVKEEMDHTPIQQAPQADDHLMKEEEDRTQVSQADHGDVIRQDSAFTPVKQTSGDSWDEFSDPDPESSDEWLPSGSPWSSRASSPERQETDPASSRDPAPAGRKRQKGHASSSCRGEDPGWHQGAWEPNTVPFTASPGPRDAAAELDSDLPADFLELFLTDELLQHIVDHTNVYARQYFQARPDSRPHSRGNAWRPVSVPELKTFFGLSFLTGCVRKPNLELYWSVDEVDATPYFNKTMSRNRFQIIWKFLRYNHNAPQDEPDRVHKVRPVLDYVVQKFKQMYQPGQNICIDEGMMPWRGRPSFGVHTHQKPVKSELKSLVLRDSATGYCFNMRPCVGEARTLPEVVLSLLDRLSGHGYTLYVGRLHSSVALCERLLAAQTNVCGALGKNRGEPQVIREVTKTDLGPGGRLVRHNQRVMAVAWQDRRVVRMLTTCHQDRMQRVEVWRRGHKDRVSQLKPECVVAYRASMNGGGKVDQNFAYYPFIRRSLSWSKKFVAYLFQLSIFNAYVLYRARNPGQCKPPLDFIHSVVKSWTAKRHAGTQVEDGARDVEGGPDVEEGRRAPRAPYNTDPDSRLDGEMGRHKLEHLTPTSRKSRPARRCRVCARRGQRSETKMWCRSCCVPLHAGECFTVYHTKRNYCS